MKNAYFQALLIIVSIAIGAGGMYWFSPKTSDGLADSDSEVQVERLKDIGAESASDTAHYESEGYGFALDYPRGLVVKEFDEGEGSYTIVFQKPGEHVGFQVYMTPNVGNTITGATIQRDVPSGAVDDLQEEDIPINGGKSKVRAATFWSQSPLAGKTREIWLLHNGFIFEFTAYAGADQMLRDVLRTLVFTK